MDIYVDDDSRGVLTKSSISTYQYLRSSWTFESMWTQTALWGRNIVENNNSEKEENDCVLTYLICNNRIKNKGAYKYKYKYIVTKIARICVGSYEVGQGEIELQSVLSLLLYFVLNISIHWVPKGSKRVLLSIQMLLTICHQFRPTLTFLDHFRTKYFFSARKASSLVWLLITWSEKPAPFTSLSPVRWIIFILSLSPGCSSNLWPPDVACFAVWGEKTLMS